MIKLLSCYEYDGIFSLIFPKATGGNLLDVFQGTCQDAFTPRRQIVYALPGLCSAIRSLHDFVYDERGVNLKLTGLHHDLKPQNILVEPNKLILADFGLSRLKAPALGSETSWENVHPYYSPPECFTPDFAELKPLVHRSNDVWTLGCIFTELVAFLHDGPEGFKKFYHDRKQVFQNEITHRFHNRGSPDNVVTSFLSENRTRSCVSQSMLSKIAQCMLRIDPSQRPSADQVEIQCQNMALSVVGDEIDGKLTTLYERIGTFPLLLEKTRFSCWMHIGGIKSADILRGPTQWKWSKESAFESVLRDLHNLNEELRSLDARESLTLDILQMLQQFNDLLLKHIPLDAQFQAREELMSRMNAITDIGEPMDPPKDDFHKALTTLTAIKTMSNVLEQKRFSVIPGINYANLVKRINVGEFTIADLYDEEKKGSHPVLVEYKSYNALHSEPDLAIRLHQRLQNIVELLQKANSATDRDSFSILRCEGYYQDPASAMCGVVYRLPPTSLSFTTQYEVLNNSHNTFAYRPPLEVRFQLAQQLAVSVAHFHTGKWLHRGISSHNIGFCYPRKYDKTWRVLRGGPLFLGFLNSRKDDEGLTEGPTDNADLRRYQHPEYLRGGVRYQQLFDYYSLGLVLLEIGLWKTLKSLEHNYSAQQDHESFHAYLLEDAVRRLPQIMGSQYQQVVRRCLEGRFQVPAELEGDEAFVTHRSAFVELVVEQLSRFSHSRVDTNFIGDEDIRHRW